jgi:hypothetical protein
VDGERLAAAVQRLRSRHEWLDTMLRQAAARARGMEGHSVRVLWNGAVVEAIVHRCAEDGRFVVSGGGSLDGRYPALAPKEVEPRQIADADRLGWAWLLAERGDGMASAAWLRKQDLEPRAGRWLFDVLSGAAAGTDR